MLVCYVQPGTYGSYVVAMLTRQKYVDDSPAGWNVGGTLVLRRPQRVVWLGGSATGVDEGRKRSSVWDGVSNSKSH